MIFRRLPLADEDGNKEGDERKIKTLGVDGQAAAKNAANGCACYPVNLVQQINEGHEPALVDAFRNVHIAVDGEGFVAHAEDKIEFFKTSILVLFEHGQAIKQMPRINHKRHEEAVKRIKGTQEHRDEHEFHTASKDEGASEKRVPGREALAADIKAIGDTQKKKRCANWQR